MTSFHIRGLTDQEIATLDQLAHQSHQSRQAYVLDLLRNHVGNNRPDVVIGWLRLDRWGELNDRDEPDDPPATCPQCGGGVGAANAWLAVVADGRIIGPYCDGCAVSD